LQEVVDQEKEPCGCPPPVAAQSNEFPLAQSEGLAPLAKPAPAVPSQNPATAPQVEPLVYKSTDNAPQVAQPSAAPPTSSASTPPAAKKKPGFFSSVGKFFRRIFGAE